MFVHTPSRLPDRLNDGKVRLQRVQGRHSILRHKSDMNTTMRWRGTAYRIGAGHCAQPSREAAESEATWGYIVGPWWPHRRIVRKGCCSSHGIDGEPWAESRCLGRSSLLGVPSLPSSQAEGYGVYT
jgi:hypothetical protein